MSVAKVMSLWFEIHSKTLSLTKIHISFTVGKLFLSLYIFQPTVFFIPPSVFTKVKNKKKINYSYFYKIVCSEKLSITNIKQ